MVIENEVSTLDTIMTDLSSLINFDSTCLGDVRSGMAGLFWIERTGSHEPTSTHFPRDQSIL